MSSPEPKRGRGRPSTGTVVQVRIPRDVLAAVDRRADAEGTSRAAVVRHLLAEAVDDES